MILLMVIDEKLKEEFISIYLFIRAESNEKAKSKLVSLVCCGGSWNKVECMRVCLL